MDLGQASDRLLVRMMSASTLRAKVIANNIANQNVPGYKREVVRFEDLLAEAARSSLSAEGPERARRLERVQPRIEVDRLTAAGPDGNNVNLEMEQSAMRENRLLYEMYASILQTKNSMLEASVVQGR